MSRTPIHRLLLILASTAFVAIAMTGFTEIRPDRPAFPDVLKEMRARLNSLVDYQCIYDTWSSDGQHTRQIVFAYYYKKPGKIRMKVLQGKYPGTILLYDQSAAPGRVRVKIGNTLIAALQHLIYGESFPVDDEKVVDLRGNGIHESDWNHFISEHEKYLSMGSSRFVGLETVSGRRTYRYRLTSDAPEKTISIQTEDVWIDTASLFPIKYVQYDRSGHPLRRARYTDMRFNCSLANVLFTEFNPAG